MYFFIVKVLAGFVFGNKKIVNCLTAKLHLLDVLFVHSFVQSGYNKNEEKDNLIPM